MGSGGTTARAASSPGPGALPGPRIPKRGAERELRSGGRGVRPPRFGGRRGGTTKSRREREAGTRGKELSSSACGPHSRFPRGARCQPRRGARARLRNPAKVSARRERGSSADTSGAVWAAHRAERSLRRGRGGIGAPVPRLDGSPRAALRERGIARGPPLGPPHVAATALQRRGERGSAELSPGARGSAARSTGNAASGLPSAPRGSRAPGFPPHRRALSLTGEAHHIMEHGAGDFQEKDPPTRLQ